MAGTGFVSGSTTVDFGPNAGTSVDVTRHQPQRGGPGRDRHGLVTVATTSGGTSAPLANAYTYNGSSGGPGGAITLGKSTDLIGNYPEKVSGTGWAANGDTTVTLNQCASTTYASATCDAANKVSVTLGTGKAAGIFKNVVIDLAAGVIDSHGDTCGISGSTTCYVVVVGNTGDTTASAALSFTLPSFAVQDDQCARQLRRSVKASGFPIGDTSSPKSVMRVPRCPARSRRTAMPQLRFRAPRQRPER